MRPVPSKYPVTLGYRQKARFDPNYIHRGVDYGCPPGTPVVASVGGTVVYAGDARRSSAGSYGSAYGIQVVVRVGTTYCIYAHLSKENVTKGQVLKTGDRIGNSGATGNVTGAHLHYQECTGPPAQYKTDRKPLYLSAPVTKPTYTAIDKVGYWVVDTTTLHGRDFPHVDFGAVKNDITRGKVIATTKQTKLDGKYWNYSPTLGAWYAQEYLNRTHAENAALKKNYRAATATTLSDVPGGSAVLRTLQPFDVFLAVGYESYNGQQYVVNAQYEWASVATLVDAATDTPGEEPAPGPTPVPVPVPPAPSWPEAPAHWYPLADRKTQNFTGRHPATNMDTNCLILHSTEGYSWPGYGAGDTAPHITIMGDFDKKKVIVRQHLAGNKSARALANPPGGVETNTANVFQIELVGTCDPDISKAWTAKGIKHIYMPEAPQWFIDGLADVVRWLDKQYPKFEIRDGAPRGWVGPEKSPARVSAPQRMTTAEWRKFYGIAAHQHVPENGHWDVGAFPIKKLLASAKGQAPTPEPTPEPTPPSSGLPPKAMDPSAYGPGNSGPHITWLGQRLVAHGFGTYYTQGPGPTWGDADQKNVRAFQLFQQWTGDGANGLPGPETLKRLAADPKPKDPTPPAPEPEPPKPDPTDTGELPPRAEPEPTEPPIFEPAPELPEPELKARFRAATGNANVYWMGRWDARVNNVANVFQRAGASIALVVEMYSNDAGGKFAKEMGWGDSSNQVDKHASPRKTDCYDVHGGPHAGVKLGAFWDPKKREILEIEDFWTTSNPVQRNSGSMAVLLKDIPTGHLSIWIPLHLEFEPKGANLPKSHWGNKRRYDQAAAAFKKGRELAAKWAKQYKVKRIPVFVGGDMNGDLDDAYDGPGEAAKKYKFVDSDVKAEKRFGIPSGTHANKGGLKPGYRIDRWFVEEWVRVIEQETHDAYPHTDHNVVEIYVEFDNN